MIYLFDLDGTLFDTKLANAMAYKIAINKLGYDWELEDYYKVGGKCVEEFAPSGIDLNELKRLKTIYYKQNFELVKPNKNVLKIFEAVKNKMIVTTARRENVEGLLKYFNINFDSNLIICQEDVKNKKPSPECYLLAKEKMKYLNDDFIAFEDSIEGISAARQAGIKVLKVNKSDVGIADLSGGSQAKTYLMFENENIFIRKIIPLEFSDRLKSQAEWYKEQNMLLNEEYTENSYIIDIKYVDGILFNEMINKHHFLEKIINIIEDMHNGDKIEYCHDIDKFIEKHIYSCISKWDSSKVEKIKNKIEKIDKEKFSKIKCDGKCHGDCTFTNIIMTGKTKKENPVLIDPAPDGNFFNCVLFDLAKFGHSAYGYEKIIKGIEFDDYDYFLREKYNEILSSKYSSDEIYCLKFFLMSFYFRRLKHQVVQDSSKCQRLFDEGEKILDELINI